MPDARRPFDAGCHDIAAPASAASRMISSVVWMKWPNIIPDPRAPASRYSANFDCWSWTASCVSRKCAWFITPNRRIASTSISAASGRGDHCTWPMTDAPSATVGSSART